MKSNRSIVFLAFLILPLNGCGQNEILSETTSGTIELEGHAAERQTATDGNVDSNQPDQMDAHAGVVKRHIVRTGELVWQTSSRAATRERLQESLKRNAGYVCEDQEVRYTHRLEQVLVARVPAGNFDMFLADVSDGIEHFETRRITAREVTAEFVDLEARLRVKKDTETRYRELLGDAENVAEVLKVEAELATLRADIEATEGRLNVLGNQVSLSTLRLRFYEPVRSSAYFVARITNSLRLGWLGVVEFVIGLAMVWPLVGIVVLLTFVARRRLWPVTCPD